MDEEGGEQVRKWRNFFKGGKKDFFQKIREIFSRKKIKLTFDCVFQYFQGGGGYIFVKGGSLYRSLNFHNVLVA